MPREGWIKWKPSEARKVLFKDLQSGTLAVDQADVSAEVAWDFYRHEPAFVTVVYSQFKDQLRDHRKQVGEDMTRAAQESEALVHDRLLFPRQMENHRGEPVFDLSPAKLLLRADVEEGRHLQMTPSELKLSRVEYAPFDARKFKHRIYQEVRRKKFINYLNQRRAQGLN